MAVLRNILLTILLVTGPLGTAMGTTPTPQTPCAARGGDLLPSISADQRQELVRPMLCEVTATLEGYKAPLAARKERPLYPTWEYPVKKVYCDLLRESCHNGSSVPLF